MTDQPARHQQRSPFVEKWEKRKPRPAPSSPQALAERARREATAARVKVILKQVAKLRKVHNIEKPPDPARAWEPRTIKLRPGRRPKRVSADAERLAAAEAECLENE